jgi:hypothetical protein
MSVPKFDLAAYKELLRKYTIAAGGNPDAPARNVGGGGAPGAQTAPGGGMPGAGALVAAGVREGVKKLAAEGAASGGEAVLSATAPEAAADAFIADAGLGGEYVSSFAPGAEAGSTAASGATALAEGGRNVLGMGNPGALGGIGLVIGSVLAAKELGHRVVMPLGRKLMGAKRATPMTRDQIAGSGFTLGRQLPGYSGLDQAGKLSLADYLSQNNLLSDFKTKRGADDSVDNISGAKIGLNRGLAMLLGGGGIRYNPEFANKQLSKAGLGSYGLPTKAGMSGMGSLTGLQMMPVADQVKLYDSMFQGTPDPALRARVDALRQLNSMYGGAPAAAPAAPQRSQTSSPGIDKNGNRMSYSRG